MKYIGAHVSIAGGIDQAIIRSNKLKATAFSFFLGNPLRWKLLPLSNVDIEKFKSMCKRFNYLSEQILPHSGYLMNLGHPCNQCLEKSRLRFIDEIIFCEKLGLSYLNFHPGSHLNKISETSCLRRISSSINFALEKTTNIKLVIENTAGQGSNVGYCFEHLAEIIYKIEDKNRVGVCLDTCHLYVSGYNLSEETSCKKTFEDFNNIVGFNYLSGMHLNDSKKMLNSRIDRHNNLGKGYIGKHAFNWIIKHINFKLIPMILETSNKNLWREEIIWINSI